MLICCFVPSDFGKGITIPIPKGDSLSGAQKIENFRGITLSPVVSKVFEHCLLTLLHKYLYTSDNQFGFKSQIGCSHAIHVLRNTIDFL